MEKIRSYAVSRFITTNMNGADDFINHDIEEMSAKLISIKGIGKWTVEMFLIFHMQAPNIFPLGDIGLINAIKKNYSIDEGKNIPEQCLKIGSKFEGYKTIATWYLWRSIDPVPVEY